MTETELFKKCKYNTSKTGYFVGYCDLPKYKTEKGQRLVECCADNDCKDLVIKDD